MKAMMGFLRMQLKPFHCRCMLRNDDLFDKLRQITPRSIEPWGAPNFDYTVNVYQYTTPLAFATPAAPNNTFRALIVIDEFAAALDENAQALEIKRRRREEKGVSPRSRLVDAEAGLICEIVALGRFWSFEVGANRLILTLVDGVECNVDASVTVMEDELNPSSLRDEAVDEIMECPKTPTTPKRSLTRKELPLSPAASALAQLPDEISTMSESEVTCPSDEDFDLCDTTASSTGTASPDPAINDSRAGSQTVPSGVIHPDTISKSAPSLEGYRGERLEATYVELIKCVILESPGRRATVTEIVNIIRGEFPSDTGAEEFDLVK